MRKIQVSSRYGRVKKVNRFGATPVPTPVTRGCRMIRNDDMSLVEFDCSFRIHYDFWDVLKRFFSRKKIQVLKFKIDRSYSISYTNNTIDNEYSHFEINMPLFNYGFSNQDGYRNYNGEYGRFLRKVVKGEANG